MTPVDVLDLFRKSGALLEGHFRLTSGPQVDRYRGWIKSKQESPDLQRAIDDVLEGRPVRRPETRTFGCAVDRH